jgi:serine/threonine-protein kinase
MGDGEPNSLNGQTLGKFLVRRSLGAGGMGAVYEAEHVITKRVGALKLLHPSAAANAQIVERFQREASAAGRIGSRHIVETLDAGELPSGEPYIFMELLEGAPVRELLERQGRLSFEEAREIVQQAAEGLAAAHAANIVHRDVKPENLFLCRGEPATVKLLDFGISKFNLVADQRLTAEGAPLGTPYYMSPEQVAGKSDITPGSDIDSLGVVLYELLTGKVPFDAATLPALSIKIFEGNYELPSSVLGSLPVQVDALIARAMASTPNRRFASMHELREALLAIGERGESRSLSGTLASGAAVSLDVTADLATSSQRPPATVVAETPQDSLPRRTLPSTDNGRAPRLWGLGGVAAVALALVVWLVRQAPAPAASSTAAAASEPSRAPIPATNATGAARAAARDSSPPTAAPSVPSVASSRLLSSFHTLG